jgi:hypothetical protein
MPAGSLFLPLSLACALLGCATGKSAEPVREEPHEREERAQELREDLARDQEEAERRQRTEDFINRSDRRR